MEPNHLAVTRAAYDTVAAHYARSIRSLFAARPLDRALLAAFAETAQDGGPVADLGCGPGHVTAHLRDHGVHVIGLDLSPEMIALARRAYPGLRFCAGTMTDLPVADGVLGGIVARLSTAAVAERLGRAGLAVRTRGSTSRKAGRSRHRRTCWPARHAERNSGEVGLRGAWEDPSPDSRFRRSVREVQPPAELPLQLQRFVVFVHCDSQRGG